MSIIDLTPPWLYHGQYRTMYPSGSNRRQRKITIPADALGVARYEIYSQDTGILIMVPAKIPKIAPIIVTEG